ncbi:hypothetical protein BJX62DRAFT_238257 [Aspergillus germanicus]
MSSTHAAKASAKPRYKFTEKHQALIHKYATRDCLDTVGSIFDISSDFIGVIEDPLSPGSWWDVLNDGWTLGNMVGAQGNAKNALESIQNQLESMGGTLDSTKDMISGQSVDIDAIEGQLNHIMHQQQVDTAMVLGSLNGISWQIGGMWSDMEAWFGSMQGQFSVNDELESQVEWGSIFGLLLENQMRITWAVEMAQNISITDSEAKSRTGGGGNGGETMPLQYNAQGLNEWGTQDSTLKLPRVFGYLVALQAQGYGVLVKARQYLALPQLSLKELLMTRLQVQTEVAKGLFQEMFPGKEWIEGGAEVSHLVSWNYEHNNNNGTAFIMVPDSTRVVCGVSYADLPPANDMTTAEFAIQHGTVKPGTTAVENLEETNTA